MSSPRVAGSIWSSMSLQTLSSPSIESSGRRRDSKRWWAGIPVRRTRSPDWLPFGTARSRSSIASQGASSLPWRMKRWIGSACSSNGIHPGPPPSAARGSIAFVLPRRRRFAGSQGALNDSRGSSSTYIAEDPPSPSLAAETARRLACDSSVVRIVEDADGEPLDVGRKTRSIPPARRTDGPRAGDQLAAVPVAGRGGRPLSNFLAIREGSFSNAPGRARAQ